MLRIEIIDGPPTVVRAAGRLAGPWVAELRRAIEALPGDPLVEVDLSDVSSVDADGVAYLKALAQGGTVNLRCSVFVAVQLA